MGEGFRRGEESAATAQNRFPINHPFLFFLPSSSSLSLFFCSLSLSRYFFFIGHW
ncbi:hypothetical protein L873DRAFT_1737812 [Choiromyces venosus 120613-1]|uniref:Uncharacterized protein n=1 Tax=Choiromyces venosus 120613-1 TaxID=1336337 RepID=A0A3N4JNB9_9PEZI|nr:hypothetical protein L873DRAFT_1737812 [Choiromyces venosus 120613-1]